MIQILFMDTNFLSFFGNAKGKMADYLIFAFWLRYYMTKEKCIRLSLNSFAL